MSDKTAIFQLHEVKNKKVVTRVTFENGSSDLGEKLNFIQQTEFAKFKSKTWRKYAANSTESDENFETEFNEFSANYYFTKLHYDIDLLFEFKPDEMSDSLKSDNEITLLSINLLSRNTTTKEKKDDEKKKRAALLEQDVNQLSESPDIKTKGKKNIFVKKNESEKPKAGTSTVTTRRKIGSKKKDDKNEDCKKQGTINKYFEKKPTEEEKTAESDDTWEGGNSPQKINKRKKAIASDSDCKTPERSSKRINKKNECKTPETKNKNKKRNNDSDNYCSPEKKVKSDDDDSDAFKIECKLPEIKPFEMTPLKGYNDYTEVSSPKTPSLDATEEEKMVYQMCRNFKMQTSNVNIKYTPEEEIGLDEFLNIKDSNYKKDCEALKKAFESANVDDIEEEIIARMFDRFTGYLRAIEEGILVSSRHTEYHAYTDKNDMEYAGGTSIIGHHNFSILVQLMNKTFTSTLAEQREKLSYFLLVLLPELVVIIVMGVYKLNKKDALNKMFDIGIQVTENSKWFLDLFKADKKRGGRKRK